MRKIEIEKSDRVEGIKMIEWTHPMECTVTHLTWAQYDAIVAGVEKIRQPAFDTGITETELAQEDPYDSVCGHFHPAGTTCPNQLEPCGKYNCCIN